jgi:hypothetical protein
MGVATLRVDGFVSLEAGAMGGELITEPLPAAGRELWMNGRTVGDGLIAIDLLDRDLRPLPGDEMVFRGDACAQPLTFGGSRRLPVTADGTIRLRIYLERAALYGLTVGDRAT